MHHTKVVLLAGSLLWAGWTLAPAAQQSGAAGGGAPAATPAGALQATDHPVLPRDLSRLWLAPVKSRAALKTGSSTDLAAAFALVDSGEYAKALPQLEKAPVEGALADYAAYYTGLAQLGLDRGSVALRTFQAIQAHEPAGYLSEAAALAEADADIALDDHAAAIQVYERLAKVRTTAPEEVLLRLGRSARALHDHKKAAEAFARVYYEFPLTPQAELAYAELDTLETLQRLAPGNQRYELELGRAERLFGARQYGPARTAFTALKPHASGDERDLVQLRIAESNYYLRRFRDARDQLRPFLTRGPRQGEALFFYALTVRELGDRDTYVKSVRRIVDEFPTQTWAAEALNNLGTHYILLDQDDRADAAFRELYDRNPKGPHAERAAWKAGWRAYRTGRNADTIRYFEQAAADFPRSDYRPSWLYWAGRAHERSGHRALADARYTLTATDYLNSYYGRLAVKELEGKRPAPRVVGTASAPVATPAPNESLVRALLAIGRFTDAEHELKYAHRIWGNSAPLQATLAWVYRQQGLAESGGRRQFDLLRGSINAMRRAYPQFMAAGGEELPRDVLEIIFPLSYWDLIRKHAEARDLDPYLVAALVAQESTFVRDIRSPANAVGLMQLLPSTARRYARQFGLRYSSRLLTTPETNIRIGTAYLADKVKEFGGMHLALASYNAGEAAVRQWMAERPGLVDRAEFIDDIPYPETQNYVKRILGTAEDYRRLYEEE